MTQGVRKQLADEVRGPVWQRGDDGYDDELQGFQAGLRHHPAVVVGATCADDVRAAVRYAVAQGIAVAVQSTGHGLTVQDEDGVLITTKRLAGIEVEPDARRARVQAGARWADVVARAAEHGLAPLSGSAPHVGVAGYTLGGGIGLLSREYGYAADHVRSLEVVTADGRLRQVDAGNDADLFWALRGGRDNFGIVTALEIDLFPVARIYGGGLFFDADRAPELFDMYRRWSATLPENTTTSIGMLAYPPVPSLPEALRGRHAVHVRLASTDLAGGPELMAPWREMGEPLLDHLGELPYAQAGSIYREPDFPHAYHGNAVLVSELTREAAAALCELAGPGAPVPCIVDVRQLGGAMSRPPAEPSAICFREATYILRVLSGLDGQDEKAVRAAHQRVYDAVAPWTLGRSVAFVYGRSRPDEYVHDLYDEPTLARLARIKAVYDPNNVFRRNHNIAPAG